jgi:thermitase
MDRPNRAGVKHPIRLLENTDGVRAAMRLPVALALTFALAACGGTLQAPAPADQDPDRLLTLQIAPGETPRDVEARLGGRIVFWEPGDVAVVALESVRDPEEGGEPNTLSTWDGSEANVSVRAGQDMQFEGAGMSAMWAGGMSTMWAGGMSTMWAGGMSVMWAGGQYTWLPENTATWQQIDLWEGQSLADGLGYGVKVAIIDTGADLGHPALVEALAPADELWDFYDRDERPQEEQGLGNAGYGHGSNVAGIVRQIAPRATIMPLRALGPDGVGEAADVAAAIHWAVSHGADVINLSLGAAQPVQAVREALRIATSRGVLVVASVGDSDDRRVTYPASKTDVSHGRDLMISVTGVDARDAKTATANHSRTKVEVAAPGLDIYGPQPEERMAAWSGTSMSAAIAAGALALALGEELEVERSSLTALLKESADDIYAAGLNDDYRSELGSGRIDVGRFIRSVTSAQAGETQ